MSSEGEFSPYMQAPPGVPTAQRAAFPVQPMGSLTNWLMGLTITVMITQMISALVGLGSMSVESDSTARAIQQLVTAAGLSFLFFMLSASQIIVGVIWFYRARSNVDRLGHTGGTWGPGWAAGSWFIPLANAVLPLFVIREIHKGSDPQATPETWKQMTVPAWVYIWWVLWAVNALMSVGSMVYGMFASMSLAFQGGDPESIQPVLLMLSRISAAFYIAAGVFFIKWMKDIEAWQDQRAGHR